MVDAPINPVEYKDRISLRNNCVERAIQLVEKGWYPKEKMLWVAENLYQYLSEGLATDDLEHVFMWNTESLETDRSD